MEHRRVDRIARTFGARLSRRGALRAGVGSGVAAAAFPRASTAAVAQGAAPPSPLNLLSPEVKVGQMLLAGVDGTTLTDDARHLIGDLHVGNVILMGPNVDSPAQVRALTADLRALAIVANGLAPLVATDQEGGLVQRLHYTAGFTPLPAADLVGAAGAAGAAEVVRAYGRAAGEELRAVGVTMAMAPVLDVNDNPTNPVIGSLGRSFGATPAEVEAAALPFAAGLRDAGVAAVGKHFPGHGSTTADSHKDLPYVEKDRAALEAVELAPYRAAIAAGLDAVMPAHVVYPALDPSGLPATVSAPIQTGLLRETMGFSGVIVTDDLGMAGITQLFPPEEAAVRAVEAGADLLTCVRLDLTGACPPEMLASLRGGQLRALAEGRLSRERVDASVRRVLALKTRLRAGSAPTTDLGTVGGAAHLRAVAAVLEAAAARRAATGRP